MIVDVLGLPIRGRDGLKCYALCDPEDFPRLNEIAWTLLRGGYVRAAGRGNTSILLHRVVMGLEPRGGHAVGLEVDHINSDRLDNRKANLRIVTRAQNAQNVRPRTDGSSRFRGVSIDRATGKWRAEVTLSYKKHFLGLHATEEEAHEVAAAFRAAHMPFSVDARA